MTFHILNASLFGMPQLFKHFVIFHLSEEMIDTLLSILAKESAATLNYPLA